MKCDEIQEMLNDYVDGTLSSDSRRIVDSHLPLCEQCRQELQELQSLLNSAQQLAKNIQPPRDLWRGIAHRINEPDVRPVKEPARRKSQGLPLLTWWQTPVVARFAGAFGLLAIVLISFWYTSRMNVTGWEVASVTGSPHLEEGNVAAADALDAGNVIVTDANSSAMISNTAIGNVRIEPNSRLRLLQADKGEHRFALDRGMINASTWVPPRVFIVETPSAVAVDLGCEYRLMVDSSTGNGRLLVTAGWVALEWQGKTSVVPAAAFCETRPGIGPGTPYSEYASDSLRRAIEQFDFSNRGEAVLSVILNLAQSQDAVTLWHLLGRVSAQKRGEVYDRFAAILPPPENVTREGILALDTSMLNAWWEEFAFMPLSDDNPVFHSNTSAVKTP